ncbi:MAG: phosphoenolpyruvate synthase [Planctomycetota bacterium]|nr:MAG: phosphoenolpyruvate synthase [Planctomycetota bacterium]
MEAWASTGLKGLDEILCGLNRGDNIVWQVDSIEDYCHFVRPYIRKAIADGRNVVYMRFAMHEPLVEEQPAITTYRLDSTSGFEAFSTQVHTIISQEGPETYYLFDCLSDLQFAWATDMMIDNFFMVTCPYLFDLDTITYFAILRNHHSFKTIARIRATTQLLLDVYDFEGAFYVHPLKVWQRYSPTMFLPHLQKAESFSPIISSVDASNLFSHIAGKGLDGSARMMDYWDRLFMKAESLLAAPEESEEVRGIVEQLCRIMVGREKRIWELAQSSFSLQDLINIKNRLIGSGFIGGKAAGMLLAQKILSSDSSFDWSRQMEPHDSFYVGSDVFYSYIIENGWWKQLMEHKTKEGYFKSAPGMKENLLKGKFPGEIRERFQEMIEYFGQSPIIVRSSSLLEDSFGNAFAGKYESIFLVNQGGPESRYREFEDAVRRVYASTMDEDALMYRLKRGLDEHDEQMALLVQRVSGSYKRHYFFPDLAGVGVSHNTFVWKPHLDPKAGMLRLVFGLGTRAVDRVENDYPQTIALDEPLLRPWSTSEDATKFSQHHVDLLDTKENSEKTISMSQILEDDLDIRLDLIATRDYKTERKMKEMGMKGWETWALTFKKLLSETEFTRTMQRMLKTLESYYQYPVDIEFTANFTDGDEFKINLLQCRPLQTRGLRPGVHIPDNVEAEKILFESCGYTMGGSISQSIKRIIYVEPEAYIERTLSDKYDIARLVGNLNGQIADREATPTILIGPGRWGTTTPSLGVPVSFSEINNVVVLVEVAYEGANLMPDLSFGTHFFQDLVEGDIFYIALFPKNAEVTFNRKLFSQMPNKLTDFAPQSAKYADVVKVYEIEHKQLEIMCDILSQRVVCMFM